MPKKTISQAMTEYVELVAAARSERTAHTYANALKTFKVVLTERRVDPETSPAEKLSEDAIAWLASHLKPYSPATEQLYLTAANGFYQYLVAEHLADINLPRLTQLLKQRARQPGIRLPQFPAEDIERVIEYVSNPANFAAATPLEQLRALRDRAFILALADTGLRVHEACALRRGDMDWNEGRAIVIGKGNKQAVIRFTSRSMAALKDYLALRAGTDGGSGRQLAALPLFARHDKGAGKKVKPITTTTGRNIVAERARAALGDDGNDQITPHSFRHYFVTTVLRGTGNLRYAQELARHKSIQVTQRYTHFSNDELDKAYYDVFERKSKD